MNPLPTKKLALNGLMIALVFLTTYFTRFPGPVAPGYINLGDAAIMVAAVLLGSRGGMVAGALGSFLADILASAFVFAPATLLIKGLEGFVIGAIARGGDGRTRSKYAELIAVISGALVMIIGYFAAEAFILGFFDKTLGMTAALSELPFNGIQGGASIIIGYLLVVLLKRSKLDMNL